jgi:hypothetical protein
MTPQIIVGRHRWDHASVEDEIRAEQFAPDEIPRTVDLTTGAGVGLGSSR